MYSICHILYDVYQHTPYSVNYIFAGEGFHEDAAKSQLTGIGGGVRWGSVLLGGGRAAQVGFRA